MRPSFTVLTAVLCTISLDAALPHPAAAQLRGTVLVAGLTAPLGFVQDPGDPAVQYVVEQGGRIRVVRNGELQPADFLDLTAVVSSGGERGLLGMALPPDYRTSGRVFVNFTNSNGDTIVARFRRSAAHPLVADTSTRFDLLWPGGERVIRQPYGNHNGGHLAFGPDGYLYIGLGDGGSGDDPEHRAQDGSTLLGKMLRIDVGVPDGDGTGYRIPADNPFLSGPVPALPEIWAFGLRNPWRYGFDDPVLGGTGALVIGDVGQAGHEEIDYEPRQARGGRNYGWRLREGAHPHIETLPPAFLPLTDPIFEYPRGVGFAVIGGLVYRGRALGPGFYGRYFYGDINGRVWSLGLRVDRSSGEASVIDQIEHTAELSASAPLGAITSFGVDAAGEIYIVNQSAGSIVRVFPADGDADGLPDWWETAMGLAAGSASGADGASGDPDGDGRTNEQEFIDETHPRGGATRYFAEGAVNGFFDATFAIFNPSAGQSARVLFRYLRSDGRVGSQYVTVPPLARRTLDGRDGRLMATAEFATVAESDVPVVVDRTMKWDGTGYGSHAETSLAAPALEWYLTEGATHSGFQLFYVVANPHASAVDIQVRFLRPTPAAPVVRRYQMAPTSRLTIWVNHEDPALASTDVSGVITSLSGLPVVVERAMYLDVGGRFFGAGHAAAGVTSPSARWFLAEGATGSYFGLYLLLANPQPTGAIADVRYLLPGGGVVSRSYPVEANSRRTVYVNGEDARLAGTAVSIEVTSRTGLPIVAERAMWWPGHTPATWQDAHASAGTTETGVEWALAEGEQGGASGAETFIVIANTSDTAGSARVSLYFEDGSSASRTVALPATSRTNVPVGADFPEAAGRRFGTLVQSLGATPVPIVVERAMYTQANQVAWAAGTAAFATRLR